jgi:hypothetical protein
MQSAAHDTLKCNWFVLQAQHYFNLYEKVRMCCPDTIATR